MNAGCCIEDENDDVCMVHVTGTSDPGRCSLPHCFFLSWAVRVEFVKDRYTVETADTSTATVCMTKTGTVDFDVTVAAIPKEIPPEGFSLGEGEEPAKGG